MRKRRKTPREERAEDDALRERLVAQVEAQIEAEIATRNRTGIPEHEWDAILEQLAIEAAERGDPGPLRRRYPQIAEYIQGRKRRPGNVPKEPQDLSEHETKVRAAAYYAKRMKPLLPKGRKRQAAKFAADESAKLAAEWGERQRVTEAEVKRELSNASRRKPHSK